MTRRIRKSDLPRDELGRLRDLGQPDEMAHLRDLADRVDADQALSTGMDLFDGRRFFEAYVHFATAWKHARAAGSRDAASAECLRFLAQAAAGWCHVQRDNPQGAVRILTKARRGLRETSRATTPAEALPEVDVPALLALLDASIARLEAGEPVPLPRELPRAQGPEVGRR